MSPAISVGFYLIAFAEAFRPLSGWIEAQLGMPFDPRMVSIPSTLLLLGITLSRGAAIGVIHQAAIRLIVAAQFAQIV